MVTILGENMAMVDIVTQQLLTQQNQPGFGSSSAVGGRNALKFTEDLGLGGLNGGLLSCITDFQNSAGGNPMSVIQNCLDTIAQNFPGMPGLGGLNIQDLVGGSAFGMDKQELLGQMGGMQNTLGQLGLGNLASQLTPSGPSGTG